MSTRDARARKKKIIYILNFHQVTVSPEVLVSNFKR